MWLCFRFSQWRIFNILVSGVVMRFAVSVLLTVFSGTTKGLVIKSVWVIKMLFWRKLRGRGRFTYSDPAMYFNIWRERVCCEHVKRVNETFGCCIKSLGLWPSLENKAFILAVAVATCLSVRLLHARHRLQKQWEQRFLIACHKDLIDGWICTLHWSLVTNLLTNKIWRADLDIVTTH